MSGQVDVTGVTAGQLAQARGCYPENYCHGECVDAARSTLARVDELDEREREELATHVAWVRKQQWS